MLEPTGDVEIAVGDTGPGIPPEVLPNVFEPFVRGQPTGAAPARGEVHMGLGLALVRSHVTALGGACTVESEAGQGATFRVTLPAKLIARNGPGRTAVAAEQVAEVTA
jgi:signal transduction histidine kinase